MYVLTVYAVLSFTDFHLDLFPSTGGMGGFGGMGGMGGSGYVGTAGVGGGFGGGMGGASFDMTGSMPSQKQQQEDDAFKDLMPTKKTSSEPSVPRGPAMDPVKASTVPAYQSWQQQ